MGGYKSYHEYKSTDLPWVPEIPAGWHVRKLTHAISYQVGFTPESGNAEYYGDDYLWANISDLGPKVLANTSKGITEEAIVKYKKRPAKKGSLLYSFKLSVGQVSFAGQDMFTNEAIASFGGSEHVDLSYFYFLAPIAIIQNASENIYGAKILNQEAIGAAKILVPPMEEQRKIAEFLDYKTAQVDALIAKKQSLLNKLAEQRTALISQAVTKGLDPSVATKDSGAAWLGKIPAHWSTSRVKFVAKVGNGSTPSRDNPDYWFDGDFPWLNSSVVNREVVDSADRFVTGVALKECHLPIIEPPAVLVGITGQGKTRGMSSKLTFRATINQHLVYVKPYGDSINVDYLHHIFERAYAYLRNESDAGGSTKGAITCSQIENLAIPLPPLAEQEQIVRFVDGDYSRISRLQKKVKAALQRLQEYRAALITNAVTGKIDVRDFCIPTTTEQREVAHG
jgi:type I restriction enzyme S subunit